MKPSCLTEVGQQATAEEPQESRRLRLSRLATEQVAPRTTPLTAVVSQQAATSLELQTSVLEAVGMAMAAALMARMERRVLENMMAVGGVVEERWSVD